MEILLFRASPSLNDTLYVHFSKAAKSVSLSPALVKRLMDEGAGKLRVGWDTERNLFFIAPVPSDSANSFAFAPTVGKPFRLESRVLGQWISQQGLQGRQLAASWNKRTRRFEVMIDKQATQFSPMP